MEQANPTPQARPRERWRQMFDPEFLPRFATFVYHLARDPRVPWTVKASLVGYGLYLASPFDLIPDWIPGAGYIDDILLGMITINYIFARIPEEVIIEHWGEDIETLKRLRGGRAGRRK